MNIANSLPRGSILTMVALSKIGEGGGQARGDVSLHLPYGKKQIEKTNGGFFWFVR
jgi:hypothetical protein